MEGACQWKAGVGREQAWVEGGRQRRAGVNGEAALDGVGATEFRCNGFNGHLLRLRRAEAGLALAPGPSRSTAAAHGASSCSTTKAATSSDHQ